MSLKRLMDRKDMYIYPWYISDITVHNDIKKITGTNIKEIFATIEKDLLTLYYDDQSSLKSGEFIFNKLRKDKTFFKKVIKNIYKYSGDLELFGRSIPKKSELKKLSNKQLIKIYKTYIAKLSVLRTWGWVPVFLDGLYVNYLSDFIQLELKKFLSSINMEDKFSDYYTVLSSSEKKSEVQQEEIARLDLLEKISKDKNYKNIITDIMGENIESFDKKYPEIYKLFARHLKNFGWLTYAYDGPQMTLSHLLKLIGDNLKKGDARSQKEKIINHYKNLKKEKINIIKKLSLPADLIYVLNVSGEFMYIKDYRKGIYQKSYVFMDPVLEEIAERLKMSLKEVKYLVLDELKDCLINNKPSIYKKITEERINKCCYLVKNGKIKIFQGEKYAAVLKENLKKIKSDKVDENVQELKGMIAYKGKATGTVKIVLVANDVQKVNEGDILVSSATNPDLILAMKRAAAFITDMGGIISHAAIVSRELKKPCIVGTRIATHILKDGDIVEVDADNGVVKIIKKK